MKNTIKFWGDPITDFSHDKKVKIIKKEALLLQNIATDPGNQFSNDYILRKMILNEMMLDYLNKKK